MKASDARKYIEEGSVSGDCKQLIFAILDAGDVERELTPLEEQEIHALLDVEVQMTNLEIELAQSQLTDVVAVRDMVEDATEQTAAELDAFQEQLDQCIRASESKQSPSTDVTL